MTLNPDWKRIVKRAWSFRLLVLAAIFSAAEVVLPLYAEDIPRHLFAALSSGSIIGAMIFRVVAQKDYDK